MVDNRLGEGICLPRVKSARETIQDAGSYAEAAVYHFRERHEKLLVFNVPELVMIIASIIRRSSSERT